MPSCNVLPEICKDDHITNRNMLTYVLTFTDMSNLSLDGTAFAVSKRIVKVTF